MTITLRVQFKAEGARRLKDQQGNTQDPPKYEQDVLRILAIFGIPKPDYMRAIYESGFVFCNYNITRQSVSANSHWMIRCQAHLVFIGAAVSHLVL